MVNIEIFEILENSQGETRLVVNGHTYGYVAKNSARAFRSDVSEFLAIVHRSFPTKSKGVASVEDGISWLKEKYENGF